MPRRVTHSHKYASQYDNLKRKYSRLHDIQAGLDWAAHEDAEAFISVPNNHADYRFHKTEPDDHGTPRFRVLLEIIDEQNVEFKSLAEDDPTDYF